jgi:hypothetical protein
MVPRGGSIGHGSVCARLGVVDGGIPGWIRHPKASSKTEGTGACAPGPPSIQLDSRRCERCRVEPGRDQVVPSSTFQEVSTAPFDWFSLSSSS